MVSLLNTIVGFFSGIYNLVVSVIEFVINSIQSLIFIISQIPKYVSVIFQFVGLLPVWFIPFLSLAIYLSIFKFIIGRD